MPGYEKCDGFIVQLLRGHLSAVFVHRAHEQGQQIVVMMRIFSPPAAPR